MPQLFLFLIRRSDAVDYDEFEAAVVCAADAQEAATIPLRGETLKEMNERHDWTYELIEIGKANVFTPRGLVLCSCTSA